MSERSEREKFREDLHTILDLVMDITEINENYKTRNHCEQYPQVNMCTYRGALMPTVMITHKPKEELESLYIKTSDDNWYGKTEPEEVIEILQKIKGQVKEKDLNEKALKEVSPNGQ